MTHKIVLFNFIFIFLISACAPLSGTLEVGLATPTPEPGTEPAPDPAPATHTPEAVSTLGTVTGSICYPSEAIPAMTAYFEDQVSGQVSQLAIAENQGIYSVELDPGEYLAVSQGIVAPLVVCEGRAAEVLFVPQTAMSVDCETWSPARKKFGQSFRAAGPWVNGFTFWNPGKALPLVAELRKRNVKYKEF